MKAAVLLCFFAAAASSQGPTAGGLSQPAGRDFSLPLFSESGRRSHLLRGSSARYVGENRIEVTDMNLEIYGANAPDNAETVILSPQAEFQIPTRQVQGDVGVRVIRDDMEATGAVWSYSNTEKRISMRGGVRVVIQAELKSILK